MNCSPPGSSVHGISQARILEWVAISFSSRVFPTQGSNPGLPHCRRILYQLSLKGSQYFQCRRVYKGFPGGASDKEPTCQYRRCKSAGSTPWLGRSPEEGHGNPLQYSCLKNPMNRGAWWAAVHGVTKSQTQLK